MDYFEPELPFDPDIIRSFNDLNDPASWKDIQMPGSFNSKESGMYTRSCAPSPPPVEAIAPYARDEPIMSMFDGSLNDGDPDSFMEYFQPELPFDPDIIRSFNDLSDPSSWQDLSMPGFNLMTEVRSNAGTAGR
ncbi:hypothetical protein BKA70DRAFT_358421 [Coprinopsis sp. MPI-PUGE-AT-0042]|nr:hypothetical protein BKA70DRAFT_358421 [Coprinopsis sp. MPI-PUGE-AT-0042]